MTRTPQTCATQVVADLAEANTKGRSTVKRYIKTLVDDAGWTNRSASNVKLIHAALTDAGVYMDEDITDMRLPRETWVKLSTEPIPEKRTGPEFVREKDMNAYLQYWAPEAFAGMPGLEGLRFVKAERGFEYDGATRRVDLLFENADGAAVLVDLKATEPPDGTIKKLRRYLRACQSKGLEPLRAVLITGIPQTEQEQAATLIELIEAQVEFDIEWYQYRLGVTLERID